MTLLSRLPLISSGEAPMPDCLWCGVHLSRQEHLCSPECSARFYEGELIWLRHVGVVSAEDWPPAREAAHG
jgi:hypothetical protein